MFLAWLLSIKRPLAGGSMQILVADNEAFLAENIARYLRNKLSADITCVSTVKEVLHHLQQKSYDLFISDLDLPDGPKGSWLESVTRIHPQLQLIVISAIELPEAVQRCCQKQLAAYFEKPFDIVELKDKIVALSDRKQAGGNL